MPLVSEFYCSAKKRRHTLSALLAFATIISLLATINFFITPNPYAALHSGGVALDALVRSEKFVLQTNLLTAVALAFGYMYTCRNNTAIPFAPIAFILFIFASGLITGVFFSRPVTYIYDVISFLLIAALARHDEYWRVSERGLKMLFRLSWITLVAGITLALLKPNVWGYLPFEFSRNSRGEVTLAFMTGSLFLIPSLSWALRSISQVERLAVYALTIVIVASTATRSVLVISLLPFLLFVFLRRKSYRQWWIVAPIIIILVYGLWSIKDIFILSSRHKSTLEASLTGRHELWTYYWVAFLDSPIFGNGSFLLERAYDYDGKGVSEVGLLKTAAEQGIIAATIQVLFVITACFSAQRLLRHAQASEAEIFVSLLVLSITPNFVLQSHARVLTATDAFYWYSVFYCIFRAYPVSRMAISLSSRKRPTQRFKVAAQSPG